MTFDDRGTREKFNRLLGAMVTISDARRDLAAAGVTDEDIVARLRDSSPITTEGLKEITTQFLKTLGIDLEAAQEHQSHDYPQPFVYNVIQRLFRENPSPLPDQAPAIECAVLFYSGASIQGSLSETPDGGLRMLSPNPDPGARPARGKIAMVEQFFGYEDVVMVGVRREVEVVAPKITS